MDLVDQLGQIPVPAGEEYLQRTGQIDDHGRIPLPLQKLGELVQSIGKGLLHYVVEDVLLAPETIVETPVEDPCLHDDVTGGGLLVTLGEEQLHGRIQYVPARILTPLFHRGHIFPDHYLTDLDILFLIAFNSL